MTPPDSSGAPKPGPERGPITLYVGGWQIEGRFARHRCRDCGCETEPGTIFTEAGAFGSNESWPVCPRCNSRAVDLIVGYG